MDEKKRVGSIETLKECIDLQRKKANDYNNPNSRVKQADYYPNGVNTISDICWAKLLRIRSILDALKADNDYHPEFESLEDSFMDLINYASFAVSYLRKEMDGQSLDKDLFNE